jgi:hypothetical protein
MNLTKKSQKNKESVLIGFNLVGYDFADEKMRDS